MQLGLTAIRVKRTGVTKSILNLYELSENKSPENIYFDLYFSLDDYFVTSIIVLKSY